MFENLATIVAECYSYAQVIKRYKLILSTHSYTKVKKAIAEQCLDVSHFRGKAWLKGLSHNYFLSSESDEELFVKGERRGIISRRYKKYRSKLGHLKCDECSIDSWRNEPLSLHTDHKDGDNTNNLLSNLRLLCPNCHSQTNTYCGRNIKTKKVKSTQLDGRSNPRPARRSVPYEEIISAFQKCQNYSTVGKQYKITPNAVKKILKRYGTNA